MVFETLLAPLQDAARRAGDAILEVYAQNFDVVYKGDQSPVTAADQRAEDIILPVLKSLTPHIPIISEEEAAKGRVPEHGASFWLVDPLDGTKEFVKRNGEFTVNIGLIHNNVPVLGVVFAPVLDVLWAGAIDGTSTTAFVVEKGMHHDMRARPCPQSGAVVLDSRSHRAPQRLTDFLAHLNAPKVENFGSSLKLCRVAQGLADFYPRFGPTHEWDTAAGHAVLLAAGGDVEGFDGLRLIYNKPGLINGDFLARGVKAQGIKP